jgi:hypothetical protein
MSTASYRSASRVATSPRVEATGLSNLFSGQAGMTWLDTKPLQDRRHGWAMDAEQCRQLLRRLACKRSLERGLGEGRVGPGAVCRRVVRKISASLWPYFAACAWSRAREGSSRGAQAPLPSFSALTRSPPGLSAAPKCAERNTEHHGRSSRSGLRRPFTPASWSRLLR